MPPAEAPRIDERRGTESVRGIVSSRDESLAQGAPDRIPPEGAGGDLRRPVDVSQRNSRSTGRTTRQPEHRPAPTQAASLVPGHGGHSQAADSGRDPHQDQPGNRIAVVPDSLQGYQEHAGGSGAGPSRRPPASPTNTIAMEDRRETTGARERRIRTDRTCAGHAARDPWSPAGRAVAARPSRRGRLVITNPAACDRSTATPRMLEYRSRTSTANIRTHNRAPALGARGKYPEEQVVAAQSAERPASE